MTFKKTLRTAAAFVLMLTVGGACLGQTLREYADRAGVLVGAAVEPRLLEEPEYAATLAREFNMLTAENALKWGAIRPTRERFNFEPGDRLVAFARQHRVKVRGHCLAWSEYNPGWLSKGKFTPEQMSELLREHITKVMQHYKGKVFAWDVVNEIFLADGSVEPSVWYDQPGIGLKGKGTAYVEQAFRWARAAEPEALLFYNDYDTEGINAKSDAVYEMVKGFRARGVPIDGVGIQAHITSLTFDDIATIDANIARLVALGVQVHITEMDVGLPTGAGLPDEASLKRQAEVYRFIARACLRQPRCTAFQTWGFTDKHTWIPNFTKGAKGAPLPFDAGYRKKPAYEALLEAFRERAGGLNLYRRNFGEQLENVASSGEYHWMAGNFIRYAGPLKAADLPVDSHELLALIAPRPVFVGAGTTQQGDGWVDAKGMFLATAAAVPVYTLLGKKGLGTTEVPNVETALIDGDVAYRQHAGGHTPGPNWPTFITFAGRYLK